MQEGFNRILVLTDFSPVSLHAAEEAAIIASKFNSEFHLLHVIQDSVRNYLLTPEAHFFRVDEEDKEAERIDKPRPEQLKETLKNRYGINAQFHAEKGILDETVIRYVHNLRIDLVVLGAKRKNRIKEMFFESKAKKIIKSVDSEVLCVYPESNSNQLKKIVLPVEKTIPKKKIRLAYELANKFGANIHLISLNKNESNLSNEDTKVLMASYQYMKDITNIPVECRTVSGSNIAQAAVRYAENIGADLILVNAGTESHLKGAVLHGWGGDIVNHSSIPVLSVH